MGRIHNYQYSLALSRGIFYTNESLLKIDSSGGSS